jgi:hypothetical protein
LNLWACKIGCGILGYTQFPGGLLATDGVGIDSFYFGLSSVQVSLPADNEMTMNYIDYTDDRRMYLFTNGQKTRMLAVFAAGGPRGAIGQ